MELFISSFMEDKIQQLNIPYYNLVSSEHIERVNMLCYEELITDLQEDEWPLFPFISYRVQGGQYYDDMPDIEHKLDDIANDIRNRFDEFIQEHQFGEGDPRVFVHGMKINIFHEDSKFNYTYWVSGIKN